MSRYLLVQLQVWKIWRGKYPNLKNKLGKNLTICWSFYKILYKNFTKSKWGWGALPAPAPPPSLWLLTDLYYNFFPLVLFLWLVHLVLIPNSIYIYLRYSAVVLERPTKLYWTISIFKHCFYFIFFVGTFSYRNFHITLLLVYL